MRCWQVADRDDAFELIGRKGGTALTSGRKLSS